VLKGIEKSYSVERYREIIQITCNIVPAYMAKFTAITRTVGDIKINVSKYPLQTSRLNYG